MAANTNRNIKRAGEREQAKNEKWIKALSVNQRKIIEKYAKDETDKVVTKIIEQSETCYAGAIIELYEDRMTYDEIMLMFGVANRMLKENGEFLNKYGSDWKMKLDGMNKEVQNRIMLLLEKGFNQKAIISQIDKEYPDLKSSHKQLAYKTAKEEWIKPGTSEKLKKKTAEKVAEEVIKEVEKELTAAETETNDMFKVISKKVVLQGNFEKYTIENGTLIAGKTEFTSKEEIEEYVEAETKRLDELKAAWEKVD